MTYQEVQDRLNKVQTALQTLKSDTFANKKSINVPNTINQLQELKESLQSKLKVLAEAEKGMVATDDEKKAADLANKGVNVKLTSEMKPGDEEDMERKRFNRLSPADQEKIRKIQAMIQNEKDLKAKNEEEEAPVDAEPAPQPDGGEDDMDVGHTDDEPDMLKQYAYDIATYAAKLYKQLNKYDQMDGEVDFPNWWQSKVILAREYISKAQHYLEFEEKQPALDQLALEEEVSESPMTMAYTKIVKPKPKANEARDLSDIQADIDKVKQLAPSMNKLPQDDPKRKGFIAKVKKLNQEKKDYEAKMHSKIKKTGADQEVADVDENKEAIKFAQFIHAHKLDNSQIKDADYLEDLYNNFKEDFVDEELDEAGPGFAHDCAAKVVHEKYGKGDCIPEKHTLVKEGSKYVVTHYDVLFENGKTVKNIPVNELDIKTSNEHWHKGYKKKSKD